MGSYRCHPYNHMTCEISQSQYRKPRLEQSECRSQTAPNRAASDRHLRPPPTTNARLSYNNSCCKCIQQSNNLTSSLAVRQTQGLQTTSIPHLSREYWTQPIDKSVKYPGEDASQNAKTDYLQRLDSYISKSTLIWDLISGTSTCPITSDPQSIVALKVTLDEL